MKDLKRKLKIVCLSLLLILGAVAACSLSLLKKKEGSIVIGAKNCTEQHILSEICAQLIEKHTALNVVRRFHLQGTALCFQALLSEGIDFYLEYSGTALLDILKQPLPDGNLFSYVAREMDEKYNLCFFAPLGFSNEYQLVGRRGEVTGAISLLKEEKIGYDPEFSTRSERKLLERSYPILSKKSSKLLDPSILYLALDSQTLDVISVSSTDGRLWSGKYIALEDDRDCLPSYQVAPLVRKIVLEKYPELKSIFLKLEGKMTKAEMQRLNFEAEFEGKDIPTLCESFICGI